MHIGAGRAQDAHGHALTSPISDSMRAATSVRCSLSPASTTSSSASRRASRRSEPGQGGEGGEGGGRDEACRKRACVCLGAWVTTRPGSGGTRRMAHRRRQLAAACTCTCAAAARTPGAHTADPRPAPMPQACAPAHMHILPHLGAHAHTHPARAHTCTGTAYCYRPSPADLLSSFLSSSSSLTRRSRRSSCSGRWSMSILTRAAASSTRSMACGTLLQHHDGIAVQQWSVPAQPGGRLPKCVVVLC